MHVWRAYVDAIGLGTMPLGRNVAQRRHLTRDLLPRDLLQFPEIVGTLQVEPVPWIDPEIVPEAHRRIRGDAAPAGENLTQATLRDSRRPGRGKLRDAQRLEKLLAQDDPWMRSRDRGGHSGLVVVRDLNPFGVIACPSKTNPPVLIDPNGVLSLAIAFESLELTSRWHLQGLK